MFFFFFFYFKKPAIIIYELPENLVNILNITNIKYGELHFVFFFKYTFFIRIYFFKIWSTEYYKIENRFIVFYTVILNFLIWEYLLFLRVHSMWFIHVFADFSVTIIINIIKNRIKSIQVWYVYTNTRPLGRINATTLIKRNLEIIRENKNDQFIRC